MSDLAFIMLAGDIRLNKTDSVEHIEGSAQQVRRKPKTFSQSSPARNNLTKD